AYYGIRDDIDYRHIPWRNGRFDIDTLSAAAESSGRMERLRQAWHDHPGQRSVVFCVSQRHALFVRNWLQSQGISAAAVFSGEGSDERSRALADLEDGALTAICVVDLFNEGLDLPAIDRVIMLRPTESSVIFTQQLGRGLRAAPGKSCLTVIDFVGNHRVFAQRMIHLLSLDAHTAGWADVRKLLDGEDITLPQGCTVDLELEAKDLLAKVLPNGKTATVDGYRTLRDDLGRRPTMSELAHRGYLPKTLRAAHDSWFAFLKAEGDLSDDERAALDSAGDWLKTLETTALNRCYKLVVIRGLIDTATLTSDIALDKLARVCRSHLLNHPQLQYDLQPSKTIDDHRTAPADTWEQWWTTWPVSKWCAAQDGRWFKHDGNRLSSHISCPNNLRETLTAMSAEIVDYRLWDYADRRAVANDTNDDNDDGFTAKVSHSGGRPILFLPTVNACPQRPRGPATVTLPDGQRWSFRLVKVACNVAHPVGSSGNQLGELLRTWFGTDAGLPGTGFRVSFTKRDGAWHVEPLRASGSGNSQAAAHAQPAALPATAVVDLDPATTADDFVPIYSLAAAAGFFSDSQAPEAIGHLPRAALTQAAPADAFIAQVQGHSMEPTIADGSWCLFRKPRGGSRDGRIVLVQHHALTDPEHGGRYTIKRYRSDKTVGEDGWQHQRISLLPDNPDFQAIKIAAEDAADLRIVGEWLGCVEG
ncbi:MAG: helicase-related protein, partial [Planctomycetota bacterium]